jgi:hypothetical protein
MRLRFATKVETPEGVIYMHKTREGAIKAARAHLGEDSIEGIDFNLHNTGTGWSYSEIGAATDAAAEAQAGRVKAKDIGGNEVEVDKDDPNLVGDVLYPNKTRANEAKRLQETAAKPEKAPPKAKSAAPKPAKAPKAPKQPKEPKAAPAPSPAGSTKAEAIMVMLKRPEGATSKQIEDATGWQSHSVRGFLGTLRKQGVRVISAKEPKQPTVYRVEDVGDVV